MVESGCNSSRTWDRSTLWKPLPTWWIGKRSASPPIMATARSSSRTPTPPASRIAFTGSCHRKRRMHPSPQQGCPARASGYGALAEKQRRVSAKARAAGIGQCNPKQTLRNGSDKGNKADEDREIGHRFVALAGLCVSGAARGVVKVSCKAAEFHPFNCLGGACRKRRERDRSGGRVAHSLKRGRAPVFTMPAGPFTHRPAWEHNAEPGSSGPPAIFDGPDRCAAKPQKNKL
jgi:hypothetical protein